MNIKYNYLFFLISGLLLGISWPHSGGFTFLIFFALIPFLIAEFTIYHKRLRVRRMFFGSFLMFLVFNLITTWWIINASLGGMLLAVLVNSFLMTFFVWIFHLVHRRYGNYYGYFSFIWIWLAFEYFHYHLELSWPWLNFGNVFANHTTWIQWYDITGVGGGTLWILLTNVLMFVAVRNIYIKKEKLIQNYIPVVIALVIFICPLIYSFVRYSNYNEKINSADVVVVQPNINPYGDKFQNLSGEEQLVIFLREAFMQCDSLVDLVVGPETALPYSIDEGDVNNSGEIELLQKAFSKMPSVSILTGMSSHKFYAANTKMPDNVRKYPDGTGVEFYNSALFIQNKNIKVYHKSQLVLGVERIPFTYIFPFLEDLALDLGGTSGTLGIEKEPKIFTNKSNKLKIAPAICYESLYGGYMAEFVKKGANILVVITNDGWWGDTPGYRQHFDYARITAISLRRSVAQSANTGISGFIDQKGDVIACTEWWKQTALRRKINLNDELSFYAKNGDYIYRIGMFLFFASCCAYLYAFIMGKNYVNKGEV